MNSDDIPNEALWTEKCSLIPEDATYLQLKMGEVVDYFKPIEGKTICEMLNSKIYHLWSNDGKNWIQPKYYSHDILGGSDYPWELDDRSYLTFWGTTHYQEYRFPGGCCALDYSNSGVNGVWGLPFDFYYTLEEEGI